MGLLTVDGLRVELTASGADVVEDVSFDVSAGEVVGIVGESGSGKTTVATALLGHARRGAAITEGRVVIDGTDVLALDPRGLRSVRGRLVAYVPQDPQAALDPSMRVGDQLDETLRLHTDDLTRVQRQERMAEVLTQVGLPLDTKGLRRYPHEFSGGQRQRLCIAMAFVCRPKLVVLDEPTTGLDVTTQAKILNTVRELCGRHDVAAVYVTHDLAVVRNLASRVLVMYGGRIVERASTDDLFERPTHPYTRDLLATNPEVTTRLELRPIEGSSPTPGTRESGCSYRPRCSRAQDACVVDPTPVTMVNSTHEVRCVRAQELVQLSLAVRELPEPEPSRGKVTLAAVGIRAAYGGREVLHGVDLQVAAGECLALLGESGSGKTTLSRALAGLTPRTAGEVTLDGAALEGSARERTREQRQRLQYVFQSPYSSLNPRRTVFESVSAPLEVLFDMSRSELTDRALEALRRVSLEPRVADRFPDQLSGGERQRVAIARALVCEPEVLICDEVTSALDVSVQASIVRLLTRLQHEDGLAIVFVTHNLALVRTIADRVQVMRDGVTVEEGTVETVVRAPAHEYTKQLIADTPRMRWEMS